MFRAVVTVKSLAVCSVLRRGSEANTANFVSALCDNFEKHAGALCAVTVCMTTTFDEVEALTEKIIGCARSDWTCWSMTASSWN